MAIALSSGEGLLAGGELRYRYRSPGWSGSPENSGTNTIPAPAKAASPEISILKFAEHSEVNQIRKTFQPYNLTSPEGQGVRFL